MRGAQRLPKTARLLKRAEFLKLSRSGAKFQSANFIVISSANNGCGARLGVTVSSKVGNSVARNRIKRHVREFFRRRRTGLRPSVDILVIARTNAASLAGKSIHGELEKILAQRSSLGRV
ncbi:MAG: ribonuclease P protein component [Chloroflexota bacterium]